MRITRIPPRGEADKAWRVETSGVRIIGRVYRFTFPEWREYHAVNAEGEWIGTTGSCREAVALVRGGD